MKEKGKRGGVGKNGKGGGKNRGERRGGRSVIVNITSARTHTRAHTHPHTHPHTHTHLKCPPEVYHPELHWMWSVTKVFEAAGVFLLKTITIHVCARV